MGLIRQAFTFVDANLLINHLGRPGSSERSSKGLSSSTTKLPGKCDGQAGALWLHGEEQVLAWLQGTCFGGYAKLV
jgi:hypothetical protein